MSNEYIIRAAGLIGLVLCLASSTNSQWYNSLRERINSFYETRQRQNTKQNNTSVLEFLEPTLPKTQIYLEDKTNYPAINTNTPRKVVPKMLSREERAEIC